MPFMSAGLFLSCCWFHKSKQRTSFLYFATKFEIRQITSSILSPPMPRLAVCLPKHRSQTPIYLRRPFATEWPIINDDGVFLVFYQAFVTVMWFNPAHLFKPFSSDCPCPSRWISEFRVIYAWFERFCVLLIIRGFPHVRSLLKKWIESQSKWFSLKKTLIFRDTPVDTTRKLTKRLSWTSSERLMYVKITSCVHGNVRCKTIFSGFRLKLY